MRRSLAKFSESEASNHTPSLADFTTTTPELKFSVHTGAHGAVVESLGRQWLLSIEDAGWPAPKGAERIAEIGPLPVKAGEAYTAQYMEAVFNPGMTSATHVHSGPE